MTLFNRILSHIARYIVVSSGTSGDWTWKKYADGWCEMEYYYSANKPLAITNAYGNYYIGTSCTTRYRTVRAHVKGRWK